MMQKSNKLTVKRKWIRLIFIKKVVVITNE